MSTSYVTVKNDLVFMTGESTYVVCKAVSWPSTKVIRWRSGSCNLVQFWFYCIQKNFDLHRISCFGNKGSHCESEGTSDYQGNFVEHQYVIYINFVVRGFTAKRHQRFVVGTIDVHYLEHWEILRILSFFTLNYYTCLNLNEVFWPNLY